jgi:hypothetical protein
MQPYSEHQIIGWLIIIGAVCLTILIGAAIDRLYLNRRLHRQCAPARRQRIQRR